MLFNFRLRALDDIPPWLDGNLQNPHLDWYHLSKGAYWIAAGAVELFRYNQTLVEDWKRDYPGERWLAELPYLDNEVASLWLDVVDLLPEMLEPLPAPLTRLLATTEHWITWARQVDAALDRLPYGDEAGTLLDKATNWWKRRRLDSKDFMDGPSIWFWSDETSIHIQWDNRGREIDGIPVWEAQLGQHAMPRETFVEEVRAFDARFIRRMHDRVAIAQGEWPHPGIALDPLLNQSQVFYSTRLQRTFERSTQRESTDWDRVIHAIASIQALPHFHNTGIQTYLSAY